MPFDGGHFGKWLASIDDPEFSAVRKQIDELVCWLPPVNREEYTRRFLSRNKSDFLSAYVELWYADILRRGGFEYKPPTRTQSGSCPDWDLYVNGLRIARAECQVRIEPVGSGLLDKKTLLWFKQTAGHVRTPGLSIAVHGIQSTVRQPSARNFAHFLDDLAAMEQQNEAGPWEPFGSHVQFEDESSGWKLEFDWFLTPSSPCAFVRSISLELQFPDARKTISSLLTRKSKQHHGDPIAICVVWNNFECEPDIGLVCEEIKRIAESLGRHRVACVFWAQSVYPWGSVSSAATLLHWRGEYVAPLLNAWSGAVVDVLRFPDS